MSFGRVVDRAEEGLIAFLLTFMTLISFTQVVARYVFNFSFVWALELVTYLFAFLIFLGMSYGVRVGGHIGVDALVKSLPPAKARVVGIVATLLCMVYAAIVFYGGWIYVAKMVEIGIMAEDIPIPQWVPRLILPLGYGFLFFRFGQVLYQLVTGKEVHLLGDEVEEALKLRTDTEEPPPEGEK
ncbi:MAG: TRAP transporter small permease [Burkholderiales bacterium]|nr:TRAP transporter small permease [Burkholderiales bacterium]